MTSVGGKSLRPILVYHMVLVAINFNDVSNDIHNDTLLFTFAAILQIIRPTSMILLTISQMIAHHYMF